MPSFGQIVWKGYFPRELPPCFSTELFAGAVTNPNGTITGAYSATLANRARELGIHNMVRSGGLRRNLGIPNPAPYAKFANYVATNWQQISTAAAVSPYSLTKPVDNRPDRAISPVNSLDEKILKRIELRSNARVLVRCDISRFYPSIYTHTIPWAVHSKSTVKAAKAAGQLNGLWANQLDELLMSLNDRQTMGIPIGPDISLVIAELLLGAVDVMLAAKHPALRAIRYIDDYEIATDSRAEAERVLSDLQTILNYFELALNPAKTKIVELPDELEARWASRLRTYHFRDAGAKGQRHDLTAYFDEVFSFARETPDESIIKYAISRLNGVDVEHGNWSVYEQILSQCATVEPACLAQVCEQLVHYRTQGLQVDNALWSGTLNKIVAERLPQGQASEALWSIWLMRLLDIPMSLHAHSAVDATDDSLVALLGLGMLDKGLSVGANFQRLQIFAEPLEMNTRQWLLCYEGNHSGLITPPSGANPWANVPEFDHLHVSGVSFFDIDAQHPAARRNPVMGGGGGGGGSPD